MGKTFTATTQIDESVQATGDVIGGSSLNSMGNLLTLDEGSVLADEVGIYTNLSGATDSGNTSAVLTGSGNTLEQLGSNTRDVLLGAINALKTGTDSAIDGITKTTGLNLQPYTSRDLNTGMETQRSPIEKVLDTSAQKTNASAVAAVVVAVVALLLFMGRNRRK